MKEKLRIGLLMNSYIIDAWIYQLINKIQESDFANITLIVLNNSKKKNLTNRTHKNQNKILYNLYLRYENFFFHPTPNAFEKKDSSIILKGVPVLKLQPFEKEFSDYFSDLDIKRIKEYNIDVFIKFGFRNLMGDILTVSKFGIWSYYHDDDRVIRGEPSGFWEVFENHPITGSILQIISEDFNDSIILYRSFSATNKSSISYNKNIYYWKSLFFIPRKLKELYLLGEKEFFRINRSQENFININSNKIYTIPNNLEVLDLLTRNIFFNIKEKLQNVYFNQWFLMYNFNKSLTDSLFNYTIIKPPKDRFWADPFSVYYNDKFYIFIEEFIYKPGKGHISFFEIDQKNNVFSKPIKILERDYHLSYPFIFQYEKDYYMIPETLGNKCIELYKCQIFPHQWIKLKTLISSVNAVDPTLLYYNDLWWLFTNIISIAGASPDDELFLFYTDNFLDGNWIPHPMNPIISDVRRARPAGKIFEYNRKLYRPSQNCSVRYGYCININEILELNEKSYSEKIENSFEPKWNKDIEGIHTFNRTRDLTIIDAVTRHIKLPF
jgi:hypothetical protein